MKTYFRILISSLLASFEIALLVTLPQIDADSINGALLFVGLITAIGFGMCGVLGSTAWYLSYTKLFYKSKGFMGHVKAASVGVISLSIFFILSMSLGFIETVQVVIGIIISVIGAILTILTYRLIFYRYDQVRD